MTETLRAWALDRVETAVGGQLGSDGGIVPAGSVRDTDHLDPRVTVAASLTGSERDNYLHRQTGRVRVIVDATDAFVEAQGTYALTEIQYALETTFTTHDPPWGAQGLQRMEEVEYSDTVNRHLGVQEWTVERIDTHPVHEST